jgi:hypothetical protein
MRCPGRTDDPENPFRASAFRGRRTVWGDRGTHLGEQLWYHVSRPGTWFQSIRLSRYSARMMTITRFNGARAAREALREMPHQPGAERDYQPDAEPNHSEEQYPPDDNDARVGLE